MQQPTDDNINPYQSPTAESEHKAIALSESDAEISLPASFNNKNYVLRGYPDRLQVIDEAGQAFELPRRPLFAKLHHGTLFRNSFRAKFDKNYLFKLSKDDFAILKTWIGRPTKADLCESLGTNNWWPLPLAALFLLPILADGISTSNILDLVIGVLFITQFALGRLQPQRWLFLLSALLFGLFACINAERIYSAYNTYGSIAWFSLAFMLICGNFAVWWIRQFIAYGAMESSSN